MVNLRGFLAVDPTIPTESFGFREHDDLAVDANAFYHFDEYDHTLVRAPLLF